MATQAPTHNNWHQFSVTLTACWTWSIENRYVVEYFKERKMCMAPDPSSAV